MKLIFTSIIFPNETMGPSLISLAPDSSRFFSSGVKKKIQNRRASCMNLNTVYFLEFPIFVYKFLQFSILCFSNSSNFQKIYVISVAASPLNKGWFKIQLKTPAPYSLQILGFPRVQFYNFQIFEFPILEFRHSTLEIVGSELYLTIWVALESSVIV